MVEVEEEEEEVSAASSLEEVVIPSAVQVEDEGSRATLVDSPSAEVGRFEKTSWPNSWCLTKVLVRCAQLAD